MNSPHQEKSLLRIQEVASLTKLSRSAIYSYVKQGLFPPPIKVGKRAVRWRSSDIQQFIELAEPTRNQEKERGILAEIPR